MDLAEKERQNPQRRLRGDERAGLGSLLGWDIHGHSKEKERDGKEKERGKSMTGVQGFLRHQAFSTLVSRHVFHAEPPAMEKGKEGEPEGEPIASSSYVHPTKPYLFTICGRPKWRTLGYYSYSPLPRSKTGARDSDKSSGAGRDKDRVKDKGGDKDKGSDSGKDDYDDADGDRDRTLGEAIREWVEGGGRECTRHGCTAKRGEHEVRYVHGGVRVAVNIGDVDTGTGDVGDDPSVGSGITMWESCAVCKARTKRRVMSDGT